MVTNKTGDLYRLIEQQVKISQTTLVAMAGFKVLTELGRRTALESRLSAMAFLLSTLAFSNKFQLRATPEVPDQLLEWFVELQDLSSIGAELMRQRGAGNISISSITDSALKYLRPRQKVSADAKAFAAFFAAWWVMELPSERVSGIGVLMTDVFAVLGVSHHPVSKTRVDCSSRPADSLASSSLFNQVSPSTKLLATESVETLSSQAAASSGKHKRVILDEEDDDVAAHVSKKRLHSVRPSSVPESVLTPSSTLSFTTMTSDSASTYFEVALSLLPESIWSCSPIEGVSETSIGLTGGPYGDIIDSFITTAWMFRRLSLMVKSGECLKFVIDTSVGTTRVCEATVSVVLNSVERCKEWRSQQQVSSECAGSGSVDVGSLDYFAILLAWAAETLTQIRSYANKFKQTLLDEGRFEIMKGVKKSIPALVTKCDKGIKAIQEVGAGQSLQIKEYSSSVRTFVNSVTKSTGGNESWIKARGAVFKSKKIVAVEEPLPQSWIMKERQSRDMHIWPASASEVPSTFAVRGSATGTTQQWGGLYGNDFNDSGSTEDEA
jgi:hypothetical protein